MNSLLSQNPHNELLILGEAVWANGANMGAQEWSPARIGKLARMRTCELNYVPTVAKRFSVTPIFVNVTSCKLRLPLKCLVSS